MTSNSHDAIAPEDAIRLRILARASALNAKLMARFATVAEDLDAGGHRAALGGLMGADDELTDLRSLLRLLED